MLLGLLYACPLVFACKHASKYYVYMDVCRRAVSDFELLLSGGPLADVATFIGGDESS